MAAITETLKLPSFRYPKKVPDTHLGFDSANSDYVDCGDHFNLSDISGQFTISLWVQPTTFASIMRVMSTARTSASVGDGQLYLDTSGLPTYSVQNTNTPSSELITSTLPTSLNRWNHVVWNVDNLNDQITFVVNGVSETLSFTFTEGAGYVNTFINFELGRWDNNGSIIYSSQKIANVRIYDNYLLPVEEAQAQYIKGVNDYGTSDETGLTASYHLNEGLGSPITDSYEPTQNHGVLSGGAPNGRWVNATPRTYRETVLHDSPKAYWRMGDTKLNNVKDETGNFVGMLHQNAPAINQVGPFPGSKSVLYTRGTSHYSSISQNILGTTTDVNAYSGEAWIKITESSVASQEVVFTQRDGANNSNMSLHVHSGTALSLGHDELPPVGVELSTAANAILPNVWHHVVWMKDVGANIREIYIDGTLSIIDNSPELGTTTTMIQLIIGASVGIEYFQGYISEVAIYDYKLSAQQVADHWLAGIRARSYQEAVLADNPYIYFPLDETSGTSPAQLGSSVATGTHVNAVPGVPALHEGSDYAARYNGTDAQTYFLVNGSLSSDSVWTVEFFAKVTQSGRSGQGVAIWHAGNNQPTNQGGYEVLLTPAGEILISGFASSNWRTVTTTGFGFNDNISYSVTVTCDTVAQKMRFYKNGAFHEELPWIWGVAQTTGTYNWRIGVQSQDSPTAWFPGDIDSVSYYDGRILSDARIAAHYEVGAVV